MGRKFRNEIDCVSLSSLDGGQNFTKKMIVYREKKKPRREIKTLETFLVRYSVAWGINYENVWNCKLWKKRKT